MLSPVTTVLVKIFVKGFYRTHFGLLLFLFVTFFIYFFFTEALNQTHLPPDQVIFHNLALVLTLISSPVMMALVLLSWLGVTVKSWRYVISELSSRSNQFLFYSSTSLSKPDQIKSWFIVQMTISLPMAAYGLFSLAVGVIFDHYVNPIIILSYVSLLSLISSFVYFSYANSSVKINNKSVLSRIAVRWPKPLFSLFLYHVFEKEKVAFVVTKLLSVGIIAWSTYILNDVNDDLRVGGIITLGIITAHAILIYRSYRFEESHLSFSRNFPYSRVKLYSNSALSYLLLTLPENVWILTRFDAAMTAALLVFNLGTGLLFRNLLYFRTLNLKNFIYLVFYSFIVFFIIILAKLLWLLAPLNLLISAIVFNQNYYRQKDFIKA